MTAIDYLTNTDTVHLSTELRDGGEGVTPIWAVVVDGVPYIRNGYGERSKWYRRVQRTRPCCLHRRPPPREPERRSDQPQGREAYRAKYAGQGTALRQIVSQQVRVYTMRIIPQ